MPDNLAERERLRGELGNAPSAYVADAVRLLHEAARAIAAQQERIAALEHELEEAKADATDWLLCMDGIKHDPRCANHVMGDARNCPCLRCKADSLQQAEATLASVRALRRYYEAHFEIMVVLAYDLDRALAGEAGVLPKEQE